MVDIPQRCIKRTSKSTDLDGDDGSEAGGETDTETEE